LDKSTTVDAHYAALSSLFLQWKPAYIYLLTYLLNHSMEQSPSLEANRFSASQEIPRISWNL